MTTSATGETKHALVATRQGASRAAALRTFERIYDQFLNRVGSDDLSALCLVLNEVVYLRDCSIKDSDFVAMVVHIQNQVLSHDCKAD